MSILVLALYAEGPTDRRFLPVFIQIKLSQMNLRRLLNNSTSSLTARTTKHLAHSLTRLRVC